MAIHMICNVNARIYKSSIEPQCNNYLYSELETVWILNDTIFYFALNTRIFVLVLITEKE